MHPSAEGSLPNGDGNADPADPSVWKRRYQALQESVSAEKKSKRKSGSVNLINNYNSTPLTIPNLPVMLPLPVSLDAVYAKRFFSAEKLETWFLNLILVVLTWKIQTIRT